MLTCPKQARISTLPEQIQHDIQQRKLGTVQAMTKVVYYRLHVKRNETVETL